MEIQATSPASARERLAVALDVASLDEARSLARRLSGTVGWLKVGSELFVAAGPAAVQEISKCARVFLDLKLHDIPHTVARAVAAATRLGVGMLTLHAAGGVAMLRAARQAAEESAAASGLQRPQLVAVTVLTSLASADLERLGVAGGVEDQVERCVELALESGLDAVVASAWEAPRVRHVARGRLGIVTPGIRATGSAADDQARTADAAGAIRAGADVLVVGRPIVQARDPVDAARGFVREIERALAAREA